MSYEEKIYNAEYAKRYAKNAQTELGKKIYASRWKLIEKYCHGNLNLLDFGCASGAFHQSSRNGFSTYGYDLNPNYGFTSLPKQYMNIITMWDSIEHMHEPFQFIRQMHPQYLFISTPNLESVKGSLADWKHYRPYEHVYYFDRHSLSFHLEHCGYEVLEFSHDEGELRDPSNPTAIISCVARLKA